MAETAERTRDVQYFLIRSDDTGQLLIQALLKAADRFRYPNAEVAGRVHIGTSGHYAPNMWVPSIIGPVLIEAETPRQFGESRSEILRRNALVHPQM